MAREGDDLEGPIYPAEGEAGPFRMLMYRGIRPDQLHSQYASDPGDYGRGEYWTNLRDMAEQFYAKGGEVRAAVIELRNALRVTPRRIVEFGRETYGYTRIEDGSEKRLEAADRFTADMKDLGYDGVVVYEYEGATGEWSACVFGEA